MNKIALASASALLSSMDGALTNDIDRQISIASIPVRHTARKSSKLNQRKLRKYARQNPHSKYAK